MKRSIVVGSNGQDGRILCERLRRCGSEILAITRDSAESTDAITASSFDLLDATSVTDAIGNWNPDAVFYLPAVHSSSEGRPDKDPGAILRRSIDVHVTGAINILDSLRRLSSTSAFFYAASSLVFGTPDESPQLETTAFRPDSIYGITKCMGLQACQYYRRELGVRASVGILYNHESPLRPEGFFSRRIVTEAIEVARGLRPTVVVGDLSAQVDWGYAPDYVDAMIRVSQLSDADDFIIASGELHSVGQFVEVVFNRLGLDWHRHVTENAGILTRSHSPRVGDPGKLRGRTGWKPTLSFNEMVELLVDTAMTDD